MHKESDTPRSILEPSAGDGRFVSALRKFAASISLAEFKEEKAKKLLDSFGTECTVYCGDFIKFSLDSGNTYDLIIGNPPYIAKKNAPKDQCESSEEILKFFNLDSSIFQNLWVSFVLSSLKLLAPNASFVRARQKHFRVNCGAVLQFGAILAVGFAVIIYYGFSSA